MKRSAARHAWRPPAARRPTLRPLPLRAAGAAAAVPIAPERSNQDGARTQSRRHHITLTGPAEAKTGDSFDVAVRLSTRQPLARVSS
jgi:hypothetical protein